MFVHRTGYVILSAIHERRYVPKEISESRLISHTAKRGMTTVLSGRPLPFAAEKENAAFETKSVFKTVQKSRTDSTVS